ncbi:MAG: hypothetical protein EOP40_11510 [Rubrivivax sp.]|nr:MAG: hypothetical protein EOP40_11510 [Rubrivivax sp.]
MNRADSLASLPDVTRLLLPALIVLLVAVWLGGGVPLDDTAADQWLQLLALPLILIAAAALTAEGGHSRLTRAGIVVALLVAAVPLLQLLPLPDGLWNTPAARQALSADLRQAGVESGQWHWTLSPSSTEGSLWALLPALAGFLLSLAVPASMRRRVVQVIVMVLLANVLFAFFQAGLPPGSTLRLYQDFDAGFGGLLVNTNHQATALIIGMVLAVGLAVEAHRRAARGHTASQMPWWYGALAGMFLLLVPLSTSRAGVAIALPALAAALVMTGALSPSRIGRSKATMAVAAVIALLAIIGAWSAQGWMQVDEAEELRHTLARAAMGMAVAQEPLGSGIGSLIPVFEQHAPPALWLSNYVNHVHNEYAQWWLTGGLLAMLALAAVLVLLAIAGLRLLRLHVKGGHAALAAACFVAVCAVLAHSWADYPLRTTALNTTVAVLAGLMLVSLADARARIRSRHAPSNEHTGTTHPA